MLEQILLSPPIALILLLIAAWLCYASMRALTLKKAGAPGLTKPYACGEEQVNPVEADYGQFFPFAFFFTILHVVALTVTTVPVGPGNYMLAALYIGGAAVGLSVLYRS